METEAVTSTQLSSCYVDFKWVCLICQFRQICTCAHLILLGLLHVHQLHKSSADLYSLQFENHLALGTYKCWSSES